MYTCKNAKYFCNTCSENIRNITASAHYLKHDVSRTYRMFNNALHKKFAENILCPPNARFVFSEDEEMLGFFEVRM